jgi:HSP20 family protein
MYEPIFNFSGALAEFDQLQRAFNTPFNLQPRSIRAARHGFPAINIVSGAQSVDIDVYAPGVDPAKIDIQIDRGLLTIAGERPSALPDEQGKSSVYATERYTGRFKRTISLSDDVDPASITAQYRDGVLHISAARRESSQARRIEVH